VGSLCLGLIVGLFPGIYLSGIRSPEILRGQSSKASGKGVFRKLLMLFQFIVSTILIICSMIMLKQFHYIRSKDLGYNAENIMVIQLSAELNDKREIFAEEIIRDPNVQTHSWSSFIPGEARMMVGTDIFYGGEERKALFHLAMVDEKFLDILGFEITDGRHFSQNSSSDSMNIIMNESGVKKFELEDPFITSFPPQNEEVGGNLVGVVKDFHLRSLHKEISPMVFRFDPKNTDKLFLKLNTVENASLSKTSDHIKEIWYEMSPNFPPELFLLSDRLDDLYKEDRKTERVIIYFTLIAIVIACLGLFGLVSFMLQQRTKEMGIRKANGALASDLIGMIVADYIKWVLLAFVIACPVAYHFMNRWLQNFAFKTGLSWWVFLLAGVLFLLLTLISTFYHILRTARTNTAESLRYE
jgi:putative ABC transport system permease protein